MTWILKRWLLPLESKMLQIPTSPGTRISVPGAILASALTMLITGFQVDPPVFQFQ